MSHEFEYFINLVKSVDSTTADRLRAELLSKPIDFWDPANFWDWKASDQNFEQFAKFIVLSIRCLDGTEYERLPIALVSNLHLIIPWAYQNIAEVCTLLLEEYIQKKVAKTQTLLTYIEDTFLPHPDFSDRKQEIISDFQRYSTLLTSLKFKSLDEGIIEKVIE